MNRSQLLPRLTCVFLLFRMKKSGVNTTEHQHAPEQSYEADKHFTGGDDQFTSADDQYAPGEEQFTAGENQYTPENSEYSEEYQYT